MNDKTESKKVVLWGAGQIAHVAYFYLKKHSDFEVCAFCVDKDFLDQSPNEIDGKPVIAFEDIEDLYPNSEYKMAVIMGFKHLNKYREEKYLAAKSKGYSFISFACPSSTVDGEIGENTFIFNKNDIQPYSKVGNNVVIWGNTGIGHHSVIEDNCFLAGPQIAGCTTVKKNTFIGVNSIIGDHVEIGSYCVIGAGSVVTENIPESSVLIPTKTKIMPFKSYEVEGILE